MKGFIDRSSDNHPPDNHGDSVREFYKEKDLVRHFDDICDPLNSSSPLPDSHLDSDDEDASDNLTVADPDPDWKLTTKTGITTGELTSEKASLQQEEPWKTRQYHIHRWTAFPKRKDDTLERGEYLFFLRCRRGCNQIKMVQVRTTREANGLIRASMHETILENTLARESTRLSASKELE